MYLDTESVGLTGPLILIQTSKSLKGEVNLYYPFKHPVSKTLEVIEGLMKEELICFNATHEGFILNKWWNIFNLVQDKSLLPINDEIREIELNLDYTRVFCLKPPRVMDIYLLIKKNLLNFAINKDKKYILIKRVPIQAVSTLKPVLEDFALTLPEILFYRFKQKVPGDYWEICPDKDNRNFVDFKLSFSPSLALKAVIRYLFKIQTRSIGIPHHHMPQDERKKEYRPWNNSWPRLIAFHLRHWETRAGIEYAKNDIEYLKQLKTLMVEKDCWPKDYDVDSDLAWGVGASRFKGFKLNLGKVDELISKAECDQERVPISPYDALPWLHEVMKPEQRWLVTNTSTKETLDKLVKMPELGRVAERAGKIIEQRQLIKQIEVLEKLKSVGRYHPNFDVVGTVSFRMSGRGGINPQGISRDKKFRAIFTMADDGNYLSGGDFEGQEVTILDAVVNDPKLREQLKSGVKLHTLMARKLFDVNEPDEEQYYKGKQAVFALFYGAEEAKFAQVTGLTVEEGRKKRQEFLDQYPELAKRAFKIYEMFCSMRQPEGIGTNVEWHEPAKYAESIFGTKRHYRIENKVCKFFFELANNLPQELKQIRQKTNRRDREQTIAGATQSALYAAAFAIQASNQRTAGNHYIQSPGAIITKVLQYKLWELQVSGIAPWKVQLYNMHDEVLAVNNCRRDVALKVAETVEELTEKVPLLSIDWKPIMTSWADK